MTSLTFSMVVTASTSRKLRNTLTNQFIFLYGNLISMLFISSVPSVGDKFHRMWRDMQTAMVRAEGGHAHTMAQNNYTANVNYQPFGQGGHLARKTEIKLDWEQLYPRAGDTFARLSIAMSIDAREPKPACPVSMQCMYERLVLDNVSYVRKQEFCKSSSWCSNVKYGRMIEKVWHARRYQAEIVSSLLQRNGKASKKLLRTWLVKWWKPRALSRYQRQRKMS